MTPEQYRSAEDLFEQIADLPQSGRAAALDAACGGNAALRDQVLRLLEGDRLAGAGAFLEHRALDAAAGLLGPEDLISPGALSPGMHLGPYRIIGTLGAGGMGEVYRARDSLLDRDAAVKILPPALACDAQYMARFEREAKVLASLNHPNITTVYGVEQGALVMELVEGVDLHCPWPLAEAIPIARQIALALEAAHERGIVHRDLKPANIKITPEGVVKLLDFGLAQSSGAPASRHAAPSPPDAEASPAVTRAGTILGTAAYMAPEQALGKPVDKRADIWAFGVVFYEMLAGARPFPGETSAETLHAVVRGTPDLGKLPPETPPHLRRLIERCLRKDPATRLRDIGEARILLDEPPEEIPAPPRWRRGLPWLTAVAALTVAAASLWLRQPPREVQGFRLAVPPPEQAGFSLVSLPAISPNGHYLAFATGSGTQARLWIRDLDAVEARAIPSSEGAVDPFWSPDSRSVGFFAAGKLKRVDVAGGPVVTVCDAPDGRGGSWNQNGAILFAPSFGSRLFRVSAAGGTPEPLAALQESAGETSHRFPWFLPDGRHYLYTSRNTNPRKNAIYLGELGSPQRHLLLYAASNAAYAPPGYLLFLREGTLMAQAFDASRPKLKGDAFAIAEKVDYLPGSMQGQFSVSQTGVLGYYSGSQPLLSQMTWFDRAGKRIETIGPPDIMQAAALSPDGNAVVVDRLDPAAGTYDLWLYDLLRHTRSRFTFDRGNEMFPVWSRDGSRVLFSSDRTGRFGLYQKAANGAEEAELLYETEDVTLPTDGSGKGFVLFINQAPQTGNDLWSLPLSGAAKPVPLRRRQSSESHGRLSPDGRYVAYESDETGLPQVYVATFPGAGGKWQVSTDGGGRPVWSRDGRELFYVSPAGKIMAVEVRRGSGFRHGEPKPLFEVRMSPASPFDVSRDGKRFLILDGVEPDVTTPITLVVNWNAGLKR